MNINLTLRQRQIYDRLLQFYKENGRIPGTTEFARVMGFKQRSDADYFYKQFKRYGVLFKNAEGKYMMNELSKKDITKQEALEMARGILSWFEQDE